MNDFYQSLVTLYQQQGLPLLEQAVGIVRENPSTVAATAGTALALYLALVRYFRFKYVRELRRKYPDPSVVLKDASIAEEIYDITLRREFPTIARQSLEMALFKTYSVPSISRILAATSQFSSETGKRVEDTELILAEVVDAYPHIQEAKRKKPNITEQEIVEQRQRAEQALNRMNETHRYHISNGDFLYTLVLFICEPIKWINKYDWRKLDEREINAIFRVWYDIGVGMKIKDIPDTVEGVFKFQEEYGRENVRYHPNNWKVGEPTLMHVLTRAPSIIRPLLKPAAYAVLPCILEDIDVDGFGLQRPSPWLKKTVEGLFALRAFFVRHAMLPRFTSKVRTPLEKNEKGLYTPNFHIYPKIVYPNGYCIMELGPEKSRPAKCPIPHGPM